MRKIFLIVFVLALAFATVPASPASGDNLKLALGIKEPLLKIRPDSSITTIITKQKQQEKLSSFVVLSGMSVVDFFQTINILFDKKGYHELDPLLAKHPSRGELIAFGVGGLIIVYLVRQWLPEPWDGVFLDSVITSEGWNITENNTVLEGGKRRMSGILLILTLRLN